MGWKIIRGVLLAALAAAVVWTVVRLAGGALPGFAARLEALGPLAPVAYVAAYGASTVALVPGSILTLAAGALFGLVWGTVYAFLGATLGASAAFLVSRHLARRAVERRLATDRRFGRLARAVRREGLKVVLLLRLSPIFPFTLLNYALGLTRIRFSHYVLASVGMLPGTLLYVYYGKLVGDVAALAAGVGVPRGTGYYLVLGLGLLATLVLTALIARIAHRALTREEIDATVSTGR